MTELYVLFQRLLPSMLLGRFVHWISRRREPWLKDGLIKGYVRLFKVDTGEAAQPVPSGYASFNEFFTRPLRDGARPLDPDPAAICCPADGRIQQLGPIADGQLLQAKGMYYRTGDLCGSADAEARFTGGSFATIYLAPPDYHRVHAPLGGRLRRMRYLPGERFAVNPTTAGAIAGLFVRNERLVCDFEADWGSFAVVLVGALNVASITTAWAGEVMPARPRQSRLWNYPPPAGPRLERGEYLGHFNLGSTVILLLPPAAATLDPALSAGQPVRVGQRIGRLSHSAAT